MKRLFFIALFAVLTVACGKGPKGEPGKSIVGPKGENGQDAELEVIELCPDLQSNVFHEYLLRINGDLFGVYAEGQKIFMARLSPGSYKTTDGRNCKFTVTSSLQVVQSN